MRAQEGMVMNLRDGQKPTSSSARVAAENAGPPEPREWTAGRGVLSRRSLLLVTSAVFVGAPLSDLLESPSAANASVTAATPPTVRVSSTLTAACFSINGERRFEVDIPSALDVDEGFTGPISLGWDPRAFELPETATLVFSDRKPPVELVASESGPGTMTFTIPASVTRVLLCPHSILSYPNDLLDDPGLSSLKVGPNATNMPLRTQAAAAWGAEMYVSWFPYEDRYIPALVEVRSVGPHTTPNGLTIELRVPRSTLGELAPDPSAQSSTVNRAGAKPGLSVIVEPLPAGSMWQMTFDLPDDAAQQEPSNPEITVVPTATLAFTEGAGVNARDTGRYSSAPVTASGSALSVRCGRPRTRFMGSTEAEPLGSHPAWISQLGYRSVRQEHLHFARRRRLGRGSVERLERLLPSPPEFLYRNAATVVPRERGNRVCGFSVFCGRLQGRHRRISVQDDGSVCIDEADL